MDLKFGMSGLKGLSVGLVGLPSYIYASTFARYMLKNNMVSKGDRVLLTCGLRKNSPQIAANAMRALQEMRCYGEAEDDKRGASLLHDGLEPLKCFKSR